MKYIKSIDSVRAFAVLLVIVGHWFDGNEKIANAAGILNGVDIFFVISGFLITRILINNKENAEKFRIPLRTEFKNFFFRRVLRIFPVYYFTIFILYLLGPATDTAIRENFIYFFTYTANLYFINIDKWDGILSHLWSLSVEEQFYIIWPLLILFIKRKYLLRTILFFIVIGIVGQFLTDVGGLHTFACFDALGLGALMAWIVTYKPGLLPKMYKPLLFLSIIGVIVLCIRLTGFYFELGFNPYKIPIRTITALITLWILTYILQSDTPRLSLLDWMLQNKVFLFIGKISYGLYLYHLILPHFTIPLFSKMHVYLGLQNVSLNYYLIRMENFVLLILLALLSYNVIEMPFLRMKRHFHSNTKTKKQEFSTDMLLSK